MQSGFEYRGYNLQRVGEMFLAEEQNAEQGNPILRSRYMVGLLSAIDALWDAISTSEIPHWFGVWMDSPTEYLDVGAELTVELTSSYTDHSYLMPGRVLQSEFPALFNKPTRLSNGDNVTSFAA